MTRVFESAECEEVRNSIFWELRYERHENQMKDCDVELRASDLQMNAWTWRPVAGLLQYSGKYPAMGSAHFQWDAYFPAVGNIPQGRRTRGIFPTKGK